MKRKHLVDARLSIILFALAFVAYALVYMTKNCYSAAMAGIVAEGIMTKSQTGLISAAFYIVYAPFQIVGGFAADKYSPHKLIAIGTLGAGIANLLIYFTQSYVAMIIIWCLNGMAQFGIWPSIFKIVSSELAEKQAVNGVVYIGLASITGLLLSYVLAVFILDWKNNFLISSIVLFVITVVFYIIYVKIEKHMVVEELTVKKEARNDTERPRVIGVVIKSGAPILFAAYVIHNMLNIGIKAIAPVMLMESYNGVSPSLANALNIILVLAGASGVFIASISFFRRLSSPVAIGGFFILCLPFLFVITRIGQVDIVISVLSMASLMLLFSSSAPFFLKISKAFAPYGCVATVSGILNCVASVGIVLSNYLFTKLSEDYGWEFTAKFWFFLMLFAVILCVAAIPIWKKFLGKTG